MGLLEEIQAKCTPELIASRDFDAIATQVNIGRVKFQKTEIGEGGIVAAIGDLAAANTFLDVINSAPDFRHIKKVVSRGAFDLGEQMAQTAVQAMVAGGVLNQSQADALKALGLIPDPVTVREVNMALVDDGGNWIGG